GSNDVASLEETLRRRFRRLELTGTGDDIPVSDPAGANGGEERANGHHQVQAREDADLSFGVVPDLILIDGGKAQLNGASRVLADAGLARIPVFGLAKRNEELFKPRMSEPIVLDRDSPTLFLVQRVRDEAHRFAITRHRARRGRVALRSRLDVVPGLGPVRRRALLREFGTVDAIRDAPVEDLTRVVPRPVALSIKELV
ncbi:MAG: excinuclease ABC subunit UvrC, partial [Chloroflexi bacterium]